MTDSSCVYVSLHRCLDYHLVGFVSFIITSHDVLRCTNYLCTDTTCRTHLFCTKFKGRIGHLSIHQPTVCVFLVICKIAT
jgi:hypothetical protein